MNRIMPFASLLLAFCLSASSVAQNPDDSSRILHFASAELVAFCDSATSQNLKSPDSSFNLHLGELVVKDSREILLRGDTVQTFVIGCVGKAEVLLLNRDSTDFAISNGRIQFVLPGLHAALRTVDLDADGTPELRVDMSGGMGAPWTLFLSIGADSLDIIRPAPNRQAFHTLHGTVATLDCDGDGILEVVEYESDGEARIYRLNKESREFELDDGVQLPDK